MLVTRFQKSLTIELDDTVQGDSIFPCGRLGGFVMGHVGRRDQTNRLVPLADDTGERFTELAAPVPVIPCKNDRDQIGVGSQQGEKWKFDFNGVLSCVSHGVVHHQRTRVAQRGHELIRNGDVAEGRLECPASPRAGSTAGAEHPGVVRCQDDDGRGELQAFEDLGGAGTGVDQTCMGNDCRHGGRRSRVDLGEQVLNEVPEFLWLSGIKQPRNCGTSDFPYLKLCPMVRPREISPLSMRRL